MVGQDARDVERKIVAILRVLSNESRPLGARIIAHRLRSYGITLSERTVRYHLKTMDERGLTRSASRRDGRSITATGLEELKNALVEDKVGLVISKIELLAYQTTFDLRTGQGQIPINATFFPREGFADALHVMADAFRAGLCASELVVLAEQGQKLGEAVVPEGMIGMGTVCSIVVNGSLLKAGIPIDSRFGGLLEVQHNTPTRFVELVEYAGSSLDPSEIFISGRLTSVGAASRTGDGKILANFREVPAVCHAETERVEKGLHKWGIGGLLLMGTVSEPVCQIPVNLNKVGVVLIGGLNPVAAAVESGIEGINHAMSGVVEYGAFRSFWDVLQEHSHRSATA